MRAALFIAAVVLLTSLQQASAFRDGEFIQAARKAQFHKMRTHWHDLLGHHSPRFGHDRVVAIPLPKPELDLGPEDEYKLQLSFNGDRHVTPWLKLVGRGAPEVPFLDVELRRSGDELLGVTAQVLPVPKVYSDRHQVLVDEFANITHWPKHLLVRYHFLTRNDVDLDRGLYLLLALGLVFIGALILNAGRGSQLKLAAFIAEMAGDEADSGAVASRKAGVPKAD